MQTEMTSDTDQSKQSLSPKFPYQHRQLSEMSFCEDSTSPAGQRASKSYHKMRPASAPRAYVTDTNIWREFNLPSYCMPDYRRTPAMYIEQDIINKQRQEIQLLMEELGNRDQELTDLVVSHQKQVKAWECDNEKNRTLQARLTQYEDELRLKEEQLKKVLTELANVNDQREVDVKELKRTQSEMIKLTERILENSLYIKEMEAQNQKLNNSLREFANIRQAFRVREQELLSLLKERDFRIADKQQEIDKLAEYIKILESQCRELGEQNNNLNEETISWRKKYNLLKEEIERLNDDCKKKEENLHKMTQQLHESLQQAIALQKALFTSCEREKCKEEVMYSLRRQHKRTMQELQNIRELYDRLTRDTTLYHLSVKEKEIAYEEKRKEEDSYEEERKKKKYMEDPPSWSHDSRRKVNLNMSFNKLKQLDGSEESFLLKDSKERKAQAREGRSCGMSEEDSADNNTEEEGRNGNLSANYSRSIERSRVRGTKDMVQRISPNVTPSRLKSGLDSNKVCFTTQTSCAETGGSKFPAASLRNQPKNSESRNTRSPSHSPVSDNSGISQKVNPASLQEVVGDVSPETADVKNFKEKSGIKEMDLSAGHTTSVTGNDGMCRDVSSDKTQKESCLKEPAAQPQGFEPQASRTMSVSRKDGTPHRDQEEQEVTTSIDPAAAPKQLNKKKCVEFDMPDKTIPSCTRQTSAQSYSVCSESDCRSPQSQERKDASVARSHSICLSKCQLSRQQADGTFPLEREERRKNSPVKTCEDSLEESDQRTGKCQHCEHDLSQEKDCRPRESENSTLGRDDADFKIKHLEGDEHLLRLDICDQCRARGRRVCDCSRASRSCIAYSKLPSAILSSNLSNSDKNYPCQKEPVNLTSKFSFVESDLHLDYCSSMREADHSLQDFSKRDLSEGPLTYPSMTVLKNPLTHQPIKKIHFSLPTVDSFYNQNQHHKVACEELPDEVSAYLARQRPFKRETNNNNNKSDSNHGASDMTVTNPVAEQQPPNGQSLSRSGQSMSSSGQPANQSDITSDKEKRLQRPVTSHKEECVFISDRKYEKDRQQKQVLVRNKRRGNIEETERLNVSHKKCDGNTKIIEDCGKKFCDVIPRFDGGCKRFDDFDTQFSTGNKRSNDARRIFDDTRSKADDGQKRCDDGQRSFGDNLTISYDSQKSSQRRSDNLHGRSDDTHGRSDDIQGKSDDIPGRSGDCHRRYEAIQRRSDESKPRFDCETGCDNSGNNSSKENVLCSPGLCCGAREVAVAVEKTPGESKQKLPFLQLKKMHQAQEKKLETKEDFQCEQTSLKPYSEVRESEGESYFCPEESMPENEVSANCHSLLLTDKRKTLLGDLGTRGYLSVRKAQVKSGGSLLLQKRVSQHPSEVGATVLLTTDGGSSGVQNDKSGIALCVEQVELDKRFCEFEDKSGLTTSEGHGGLDSRSHRVDNRAHTLSSEHEGSDSKSCHLEDSFSSFTTSGHGGLSCRSCQGEDTFNNTTPSEPDRSDSSFQQRDNRSKRLKASGHRESGRKSHEPEVLTIKTTSARHGGSNSRPYQAEIRSNILAASEHVGSEHVGSEHVGSERKFPQMDGKANNVSSAGQAESGSGPRQVKDISSSFTSSGHKTLDVKSCKVKDRTVDLCSTQKQSENKSFQQESRPGFTLYSTQEKSDNQSFSPKIRSDVIFASEGGTSSSSSELSDRSALTMSSIHNRSDRGFFDLAHTTREKDDSKHGTPTITSQMVTSCSDRSGSDNYSQPSIPSNHSSDKVPVPSMRKGLYNCAHGVEPSSLRNRYCSLEYAKSHVALRSSVLGKDVEDINQKNNADVHGKGVCVQESSS